jgi:hypothetical protein
MHVSFFMVVDLHLTDSHPTNNHIFDQNYDFNYICKGRIDVKKTAKKAGAPKSSIGHTQKAYEGIRKMFFHNEIVPGQKISYRDLAEMRTTIDIDGGQRGHRLGRSGGRLQLFRRLSHHTGNHHLQHHAETAAAKGRRLPAGRGRDRIHRLLPGSLHGGHEGHDGHVGSGHQPVQRADLLCHRQRNPIVIVDVQRLGPSTGSATKGADGDIQFLQWGNSGGLPVIVLAPVDVKDCYELTVHAFNLAEQYRCPVFIAANKEISMTRETFCLDDLELPPIVERRQADPEKPFMPFRVDEGQKVPDFLPSVENAGSPDLFHPRNQWLYHGRSRRNRHDAGASERKSRIPFLISPTSMK